MRWPRVFLASFLIALAGAVNAADERRPIVFVHGNGDSAALWITTIWRFESNGWDRQLLSAVDFSRPLARSDDGVPQPNRSSTTDAAAELAAAVARRLIESKQEKVVLVGNSRGGNAIRNYVKNGGGRGTVATAILAGATNHGVFVLQDRKGSEFNGGGTFMTALNSGGEVVPGVRFVTLRSDRHDKFAQPTGEFVGMAGKPTGLDYDAPALAGAENIVLPGLDHREVAYHKLAFKEMWKTLTGAEPKSLEIIAEERPLLDGLVSGHENGGPTNLPLAGAEVQVFEVDPATGERKGAPVHKRTIGADGRWGPFEAQPAAYYEFVASAAGHPTLHVYRTPFPRSSRYVNLRLEPMPDKLKDAGAAVTMTRPRGYLGHGRDTFAIDGAVPEGVNKGVPGVSTATARFDASPARAVPVVLNEERLTVRTWPLAEGHLVYAEFHH
jgi:pimeloyl-ACP methyl ester carboxylesterase